MVREYQYFDYLQLSVMCLEKLEKHENHDDYGYYMDLYNKVLYHFKKDFPQEFEKTVNSHLEEKLISLVG